VGEARDSAETPPASFESLGLGEAILRALTEIGYERPTPVQSATYGPAVAGQDVIVQARTGTGKTAAFGLPLVDRLVTNAPEVQALVLAPTRELALQSSRELVRLGKYKDLRTVAIYGGAPMEPQTRELSRGAQIVSGTPGRVLDHLRRGTFDPSRLKVLVLDEMDEMLSMGFARELNAILELIPDRSRRQTMCFSATVEGDVRRHAEKHMRDPRMISLSSDAVGAEGIAHFVYMISGRDRIGELIRILEVEDPESAIIFCNLKSETEGVAERLRQAGFNADWLNGDLPQREREKVMQQTREGKLRYLVATDVAARGIDISHLTHVINYSFPEASAGYVHRTGRTGRAGRTGCAISLVSPSELGRLYYLRLEYKIAPVERSLPNPRAVQTRLETDRIALLDEAFADAPGSDELVLAQRLLTHPAAERVVAGLAATFFGARGAGVDEAAAASRRARTAAPVHEEPTPARPSTRPTRDSLRRPSGRVAARARRSPDDEAATRDASPEDPRGSDAPATDASTSDVPVASALGEAPPATLYLDLGRRDGARPGDVMHLLEETGGLSPADIGHLRLRDRCCFVDLPEALLDGVIERLRGHVLCNRTLSPERARAGRM
jgi:ATP-dependent RNA helicase DeaD